ncbi:MAG: hypothetical protein HN612_03140 [Kordiimonadaceae bacterium]|nr:hypothetical protein [Kordiimonadaceae bacterium]
MKNDPEYQAMMGRPMEGIAIYNHQHDEGHDHKHHSHSASESDNRHD